MKQRRLSDNVGLVTLKNIIVLLGPLLIWPYVTRILDVENIGRITFAESVISYFVMFSGLGITSYAIREGSAFRDNREKLNQFMNEMFSINVIATLVSYVLLSICCLLIRPIYNNRYLVLAYSSGMIFNTLAFDWLFTIKEDYGYLTVRTIVNRMLVILLVFLFVKEKDDYVIYVAICIISSILLNISNYIQTRKWGNVSFTLQCNWKQHKKPILTLFAGAIATSIYVQSDSVLLGIMSNDYHLGIYAASTKIYSFVKYVISVLISVSVPRMAFFVRKQQYEDYHVFWNKLFTALLSVLMPSVVGLLVIGSKFLVLVSGESFAESERSMLVLSLALLPALIGWLFNSGVLTINRKEKYVLRATMYGGIANIVLNIFLIPKYHEVAAAITTLIAESITMGMGIYYGIKMIQIRISRKSVIGIVGGCFYIVVYGMVVRMIANRLGWSNFAEVAVCIIGAAMGYAGILIKTDSILWVELKGMLRHRLKSD